MRLNLGCGDKRREGYVNVDVCGTPDVVCDLSVFPWPWEDGAVEEVYSEHFLEHVADYERTILEIHRVLQPRGTIHFKVPHHRSPMAPWHLHRWYFSTDTPNRLCESVAYQWGGKRLFERVSVRANAIYFRPRLNRLLSWLANRSPERWDWLGLPIHEVEFVGRKL